MSPFAELHARSNFSFLEGASHPAELVQRAVELEMPALALTDRGGVYGAVRFLNACRRSGIHPVLGSCLEVEDSEVVLLARSPEGWSNLCRLISLAHKDQPKGESRIDLARLHAHSRGLFCLASEDQEASLSELTSAMGRENTLVELSHHLCPEDSWIRQGRVDLARRLKLATVASNAPLYHQRQRRPLQDVLTAIRLRSSLDRSRDRLAPNSEWELKGEAQMRGLFKGLEGALETAGEIAQECRLNELDFRRVRFPGYPVPDGETPFSHLWHLAQSGARERYHPITPEVGRRLQRELDVIDKTGLSEFFLINWDLMRFARESGIPGQGRGSAADSIIAYVLGLTRVDPIAHNLLFERFLHEGMTSTPDIDIDFSSEDRERVIQYVYDKYGWERTAMVCNVVTFRPRMAIRQVGKALDFPSDLIDRLAKSVDGWLDEDLQATMEVAQIPSQRVGSRLWELFANLVREIQGFPRHLSIHVGGMLVTGEPLVDIVPVEPATMPGRVVVQFSKDDVEDLGLIKMDLLGLRTLAVVKETLDLIQARSGERPDLDQLPLDDPEVYQMCSRADTIGVFQIESRAQMMTLPRVRPERFNDLVVEVAIIRPGPIQGNAVHPYIRRKQGREAVSYAHPLLEPILRDTLGVILYQEQILEIAMHVAAMSASGADRFRRAMTRHLHRVEMSSLQQEFESGCIANGVGPELAQELFEAVQGFAVYGFCRSHAAAFARTTYETAWLKLRHPAEFYCGLLNNQPMGFYHPSVLIEDAKRHGVKALPVDVNLSQERCQPEAGTGLRIGFNYVRELGPGGAQAVVAERRSGGDYATFDDFLDRVRGRPLNPHAVRNLIMLGAFESLKTHPTQGDHRRHLLWIWQEREQGRGPRRRVSPQSELRLPAVPPELPELGEREKGDLDRRLSGISSGPHPMYFLRPRLNRLGVVDSASAQRRRSGEVIRVGGLVITRQAPHTAGGIRFFTLEDESGQVNVTIKPEVFQRHRRMASSPILIIDGVVQNHDRVWSLLATTITAPVDAEGSFDVAHDYR
ncbi:MAG TPA: error-prone DNA polymerase [Candidatus Nitrosotalea sp.]|nr:error-prone DNA polymerase [Candidatus Nitrosotalea sp.]